VVTGASSGIGAAVARVLAEDGADVAVAARRAERLEEVAADVRDAGGDVEIVPTDVTDPDAVEALVETTVDRFGRLDVAVPNAGVGYNKPVTEMPIEEYDTMRAVNIDGMFYTARAALPHLVESSGHLVFMGSMSGNHPRPNDAAYAATKWWTRGFAASLQGTYGDEDVAVSCINPTEVRTEYGSEDGTAAKEAHEPGSVTEPIEVADAVAYVVRQESPNAITSLDIYRRDKLTHF
jgi:NADP-dependent 3-hydroxy acid dehydrogenase YdfG